MSNKTYFVNLFDLCLCVFIEDLGHPKLVSSCGHCHAYARCLDGKCSCKTGYVGDGKFCEPGEDL